VGGIVREHGANSCSFVACARLRRRRGRLEGVQLSRQKRGWNTGLVARYGSRPHEHHQGWNDRGLTPTSAGRRGRRAVLIATSPSRRAVGFPKPRSPARVRVGPLPFAQPRCLLSIATTKQSSRVGGLVRLDAGQPNGEQTGACFDLTAPGRRDRCRQGRPVRLSRSFLFGVAYQIVPNVHGRRCGRGRDLRDPRRDPRNAI